MIRTKILLHEVRTVVSPLDLLLAAAPVAYVVQAIHGDERVLFFASGLAIVPLARLIGVATEELAGHLGAAAGALLNVTFGNATELIISVTALLAGLDDLVKASLVGSILGNVLVVVGLSFLVGGARRERQHFDRTAASASGTQLALAASALVVPTVLVATSHVRASALEGLSIAAAIILLVAYGAGLVFALRTHVHLYAADDAVIEGRRWSVRAATVVLLLATVAVAFLSEWLVQGVKGVTGGLGWSQTFVGVIIVALVGNASEHASAVTVAARNKMDLSLSIALGSAAQIALFVAPVLVLLGVALGHPINLLFDTFEVAAVIVAVILVNSVIQDGESTWLEGVQLLAVYAVLAVAFYVQV